MPLKEGMQYKWEPNAKFEIPAAQFGQLYNTLNNVMNSDVFKQELQKAQQTMAFVQTQSIMSDVLSAAVESGNATEEPKQPEDVSS